MSDAVKAAAPVAATGILTALTGGIGAIAGPLLSGLGSGLLGGAPEPPSSRAINVAAGPNSFQDIFDSPFAVGSGASSNTSSKNDAELRGQIDQVASAGGSAANPGGSSAPGLFGSGVTAGEAQAAIPFVALIVGVVVLGLGLVTAFKPKKKKEKKK